LSVAEGLERERRFGKTIGVFGVIAAVEGECPIDPNPDPPAARGWEGVR